MRDRLVKFISVILVFAMVLSCGPSVNAAADPYGDSLIETAVLGETGINESAVLSETVINETAVLSETFCDIVESGNDEDEPASYALELNILSDSGQRMLLKDSGALAVDTVITVRDENGSVVSGAPVEWKVISNNDDVAGLAMASTDSAEEETSAEGTATAHFTVSDRYVGSVNIVAGIAGTEYSSGVRFEVYEVLPDEDIEISLPDMSEYALSELIRLPSDTVYATGWVSEDESVVTVDENGIVTGHKRSPSSGVPVSECITLDGEQIPGSLTGDMAVKAVHNVIVTVSLMSLGIESSGYPDMDLFYAGNTGTVFTLIPEPEMYEFLPEETATITWSSSKDDIATLTGDGSVSAACEFKKPGITTIIARINIGSIHMSASRTITVLETASEVVVTDAEDQQVTALKMLPESKTAVFGYAYDQRGMVIDHESSIRCRLVWSSDDETVAKVSSSGIITTYSEGIAHIRATDIYGEKYAEIEVRSVWELTEVIPEKKRITIEEDETAILKLSALPRKVGAGRYSFEVSSSDASIASGDMDGSNVLITGHKPGSASVRVRDKISGCETQIGVVVGGTYKSVTRITPLANDVNMYVGETRRLTYKVTPSDYTDTTFKWSSKTASIVTVDELSGEITAVSKGVGIVMVNAMHQGRLVMTATYHISVSVRPETDIIILSPQSVKMNAPDIILGIEHETVLLNAHIYPDNALFSDIVWSSDNPDVATVDMEGMVSAQSAGNAVITASVTDENGKVVSGKAEITVISEILPSDRDPGLFRRDAVWIADIPDQFYTGGRITPSPNVYCGSILLVEGQDYTCSYANNVNAAISRNEPSVKIKLKGKYSGTLTKNFRILRRPISEAQICSVSAKTVIKNNSPAEQLLDPVIMMNGKRLKRGRDYELFYPDSALDTKAYTLPEQNGKGWKIHVIGMGNFGGEEDTYEYITPAEGSVNMAKEPISLVRTSYPYTGEPLIPEITGTGLVKDVDYEIVCTSNTDVGTATAYVTGIGNTYYGSKVLKFKILPNPVSLSEAEFTAELNGVEVNIKKGSGIAEIPYVKGAPKPSVVLYDGAHNRISTSDYSVTYKVSLKDRTGTVTIKGKGKGYKDTAVINYSLTRRNIRDLLIVADDFVHSNKPEAYKKNKVSIYDTNGKALKKGTDYSIEDWDASGTPPSVGSVITVRMAGQGFYEGETVVSYYVYNKESGLAAAKAYFLDNDIEIEQSAYYVKYSGLPVQPRSRDLVLKMPEKSGKNSSYIPIGNDKYEIVGYLNNDRPGTATMILRGRGKYAGIKMIKFKIKS